MSEWEGGVSAMREYVEGAFLVNMSQRVRE